MVVQELWKQIRSQLYVYVRRSGGICVEVPFLQAEVLCKVWSMTLTLCTAVPGYQQKRRASDVILVKLNVRLEQKLEARKLVNSTYSKRMYCRHERSEHFLTSCRKTNHDKMQIIIPLKVMNMH